MRHQKAGRKLSRRKEHRTAMLANLAASLIKNGRVRTTDAKAKEVRPFVEKMVTFSRRGDLHSRRIVLSRLNDISAVKKLFEEIGPRYVNRFGGYTRIVKLGFRHGDNSPVSLIEFVGEEIEKKTSKKTKPKAAKKPSKTEKASVTSETIESRPSDEKPEEAVEASQVEEKIESTEEVEKEPAEAAAESEKEEKTDDNAESIQENDAETAEDKNEE